MLINFKNSKVLKMAYPQISDPSDETWIIAFDLNLTKLYEYARNPINSFILDGKTSDIFVRDLRVTMYAEIYEVLKPYGFDKRLQNTLVFNNKRDATIAYKAVSIGLSQTWVKYFIERVHLFKVDPNSDASELLYKHEIINLDDRPDWLTNDLLDYVLQDETSSDDIDDFNDIDDSD